MHDHIDIAADIVASFEGFSATPYRCPAGVLTIGYGHTRSAGPPSFDRSSKWSKETARKVLRQTLEGKYQETAKRQVGPRWDKLEAHQKAALISFVYNVGSLTLKGGRPSGLLRAVKAGLGTRAEFMKWVRGGGRELPGLVRRRKAEAALYEGDIPEAYRIAGVAPPRVEKPTPGIVDTPRHPERVAVAVRSKPAAKVVAEATALGAIPAVPATFANAEDNVLWFALAGAIVFAIVLAFGLLREVRSVDEAYAAGDM